MSAPPPLSRTRYGTGNPERTDNALWELALRNDWSGYELRKHVGPCEHEPSAYGASVSPYRETTPGPYWSWQRVGRSSTPLPDGRIVHIGGEHEDWYDVDFCIYNDVVIEHPDGRFEFFLYPAEIFPPTDYHSATLTGREIVLIGSLGYRDLRRLGETQLLRLDTETLRIEPVTARGDAPGWISQHTATLSMPGVILLRGGRVVETPEQDRPNTDVFTLDSATGEWRRQTDGDAVLI